MIEISAQAADAQQQIVNVDGQSYVLREYVGNAPRRGIYVEGNEINDNQMPQGFLVNQPPGSTTAPHFHETNQFQVFVDGDGMFGKKPALPTTVQYASGHTPYGPIKAGASGVRYFTLRQRWDPGAKYMPRMRDRLVRGRQRQRLIACERTATELDLQATVGSHYKTLIAPEDDGLMALEYWLGANETAMVPDAVDGGGQYHIVIAGALNAADNKILGRLSCQFVFPDDGETRLQATSNGAQVLVLRFPKLTANTGSASTSG